MIITDFTAERLFEATISLHEATKTTTVRTAIYAENATHAKLLLSALYRRGSVLSFEISESPLPKNAKLPLNSEQLAKKSVADAKERDDVEADRKRLNKKIVTAQHKAVKDAAKRFRDCQ